MDKYPCKSYFIFLAILFLFSCERDQIPEIVNTVPKIESIKIFRNSRLNQEYIFSISSDLLKEINYNDDLSIIDSIVYYFEKSSKIKQAINYIIGLNHVDTIDYIYTGNILKIIGKDYHEIWHDEYNRIRLCETIENEFKTNASYNYDENDNVISSYSSRERIDSPGFPKISISKAYSFEYDDKFNPLGQVSNAMINFKLLSENNILIEKCTTIQYTCRGYEQIPEELKTETITNYNYKYNNSGLPIEIKMYTATQRDTVIYFINYRI